MRRNQFLHFCQCYTSAGFSQAPPCPSHHRSRHGSAGCHVLCRRTDPVWNISKDVLAFRNKPGKHATGKEQPKISKTDQIKYSLMCRMLLFALTTLLHKVWTCCYTCAQLCIRVLYTPLLWPCNIVAKKILDLISNYKTISKIRKVDIHIGNCVKRPSHFSAASVGCFDQVIIMLLVGLFLICQLENV